MFGNSPLNSVYYPSDILLMKKTHDLGLDPVGSVLPIFLHSGKIKYIFSLRDKTLHLKGMFMFGRLIQYVITLVNLS